MDAKGRRDDGLEIRVCPAGMVQCSETTLGGRVAAFNSLVFKSMICTSEPSIEL